jgi:ferredoxin
MRIRLDRTVCDGFGVCAKHAPGYFSLDDWGYAALTGDGSVAEQDRDQVMRALWDCPVHAITELGEPTKTIPPRTSKPSRTKPSGVSRVNDRGRRSGLGLAGSDNVILRFV